MSRPAPPSPAKLVVGVLTARRERFASVAGRLADTFGGVDLVSPWWIFDYTDYYTAELGSPIYRRMMAFRQWISQGDLPEIKLTTNAVEAEHLDPGGRRTVNIDPGYLVAERFVLASGKNFTHRIYVGKGIYADLTLVYQKGAFRTLPWTYPDYAAARIQSFLTRARNRYLAERRVGRETDGGPAAGTGC